MIADLRNKGFANEAILAAMAKVPRHYFLDLAFADWAYKDQAFPIGNEQTISQPYTVAYQTNLVDPQPGDKILEIGTGSGYQAVILDELGADVYTIERQEFLFNKTKKLLKELGYNDIKIFFGDGTKGKEEEAPFDKILVTAGATSIPIAFKKQLKIGGWMVVPLGDESIQTMLKITKLGEDDFHTDKFAQFRFVPLLKKTNPVRKKN